ncbi:CPBP family glutamic-type intramembrane protease [Geodermatophilus maliterrae]|uniref:CPBP family glutamic-type intramembrane protease n=1 Tax=Geodermatophilus maliterrae TaxID=3162531 RepID=A0ABV3XI30_9ACTN
MSALDDPRSTREPAGSIDPPARHDRPAGGFRAWTARRPITAFLLLAVPLGWVVLGVPALTHHGVIPGGRLPAEVFALAATVLVMLPAALWVVSVTEGRAGVRALLSRTFRWRFGPGWWIAVLIALPVTSVAVGVAQGRSVATGDLLPILVREVPLMLLPVVLVNMWEETVWAGFVQTRLERRHGLVWAAALTAIAFAGIHLPMLLADDVSTSAVVGAFGFLLVAALLVRLMIGVFLRATAGSVLAVAVLHGSWNGSSGEDGLVDALLSGGQAVLPALVAVVLVTAAATAVVRPELTRPSRDGDRAAAGSRS